VSNVDGFNSSSRDDEAPLVELAVVLFFLVDILGLLSSQAQTVGANCCGVAELPFTKNKGKNLGSRTNTKTLIRVGRTVKALSQ
jgi:hypothetical protein